MIACGTCKQLNEETSRACRFCGANLLYGQPMPHKGQAPPPRPYAPPPPPQPFAPPRPHPQAAPMPPPAAPVMPYYAPPQNPPGGYRCPRCGTAQPPQMIRKMSQEGLIVLIAMLVFCIPLFWIGLLIKEDICVCQNCGLKVG